MQVVRLRFAALIASIAMGAACGGKPDPAFFGGAEWQDPTSAAERTRAPVAFERPKLVVIRADWCPFCRSAQPAIDLAYQPFKGKIDLVVLDVTDDTTTSRARATADAEGVAAFFDEYQGRTPTAGVFVAPGEGRRVHGNIEDPATLTAELEYAIDQFRARH
jgi:thiol-disulfide isomerase/thioredoxin